MFVLTIRVEICILFAEFGAPGIEYRAQNLPHLYLTCKLVTNFNLRKPEISCLCFGQAASPHIGNEHEAYENYGVKTIVITSESNWLRKYFYLEVGVR